MKEKNLFDLYKDWMETERLPEQGLCVSIPDEYKETIELFNPTFDDIVQIPRNKSCLFWGYDVAITDLFYDRNDKWYKFTDLRQTVVLLICAMHNELP